MAEAAAVVRSFPVGKRTCTLTIQAPRLGGLTNIVAEWSPTVPRRLTKNCASTAPAAMLPPSTSPSLCPMTALAQAAYL